MFESLSQRLSSTLKNLTGIGLLTEKNLAQPLKEVKQALLEADVALSVVKHFLDTLKTNALGQSIPKGFSAQQYFVKLVHEALVSLMGTANVGLNFKTKPPAIVLVAGLQGAGKTTFMAKLAKHLKTQENKTVMLASCDVYRKAAITQLKILAEQVGVSFFDNALTCPKAIAQEANTAAKNQGVEILLLDTAGRLHIDDEMMSEIKALHQLVQPIETLFVVDSMTGQDAANTAKAFHEALPLTGVVLTKVDGDARGGAALSIRHITGQPIKFLSVGEKLDALEKFHPDRLASRILGMGDMLSLIEQIDQTIDKAKAQKFAQKIQKGVGFDLEDLKSQLLEMNKMGGMMGMLDKLPGMSGLSGNFKEKLAADQSPKKMIALIDSMTLQERRRPDLVKNKGSRKRRITQGSGTSVQDLNRLLKQLAQAQKMMKKFKNPASMMHMMQNIQSKLPPGIFPPKGFGG